MSISVLVGYATKYGSTQEVAEAIASTLREVGLTVVVRPLRDVKSLDGFDAIVIGAALYMHHWHKDAQRFLSRFRKELSARPVAVFALGPVRDPHNEDEWQDSRDQLQGALAEAPWLTPIAVQLFGGRFDAQLLSFPMNRFAAGEPATDIRDWEAINGWADSLVALLQPVGQ